MATENAEKAAVNDGGDARTGGGAAGAENREAEDKRFLTQKEAQDRAKTPEEQLKQTADAAVRKNNDDATAKKWGEVGSPGEIYKQIKELSAANSKRGDEKSLDLGQSVSPTLAEKGLTAGMDIYADGKKGRKANDPEQSVGGAGEMTLSGRRRQGDVQSGRAASDVGSEISRGFGERPKSSDKNVERTPEQQQRDTQQGVLDNYRQSLEKSGLNPSAVESRVAEMRSNLQQTENRLQGQEKFLKNLDTGKPETAEQQMKRVYGAINEVLEGKQGKDGQYGARERANWAAGAAAAIANPDRNVNQGEHMTCALTSLQKQRLEAGDTASVLEEAASVVNRGGAFTGTDKGVNGSGDRKWTKVNALSIAPDSESSVDYNSKYHGDAGKRSLFGQTTDALYGQKAADLRGEKFGLPPGSLTYLAANADQYGARNGQTSTGEGLFLGAGRDAKLLAGSPGVNAWQLGELNQHMTGKAGGLFVDAKFAGDPPKGYENVKLTTFRGTEDFKSKLAAWQGETGMSAQLGVNAPFLRTGNKDGHGGHAMNVKFDNSGALVMDNNWGAASDLKNVTDRELDMATNPDNWDKVPNVRPGYDPGPKPDGRTVFGPTTGRNPNESDAQFQKRMDEQKQKDEEEKKKKEEENKKKDEDQKKQKEDEDKQRKARTDQEIDYALALARWAANPVGPRPTMENFKR